MLRLGVRSYAHCPPGTGGVATACAHSFINSKIGYLLATCRPQRSFWLPPAFDAHDVGRVGFFTWRKHNGAFATTDADKATRA